MEFKLFCRNLPWEIHIFRQMWTWLSACLQLNRLNSLAENSWLCVSMRWRTAVSEALLWHLLPKAPHYAFAERFAVSAGGVQQQSAKTGRSYESSPLTEGKTQSLVLRSELNTWSSLEDEVQHDLKFDNQYSFWYWGSACRETLLCAHEVFFNWPTVECHRALLIFQPCGYKITDTIAEMRELCEAEATRNPFVSPSSTVGIRSSTHYNKRPGVKSS